MAHTDETAPDPGRLHWAVRLGLVVLALPQLFTGTWAVLDPRSFYDDFPGFGPALVAAADGPFNAHLASDAGAGFLATGVALLAAAAWARRGGALLALLAYLVFSVPHFVYHATHASQGLSDSENVVNNVTLGFAVAFPLFLVWAAARRTR